MSLWFFHGRQTADQTLHKRRRRAAGCLILAGQFPGRKADPCGLRTRLLPSKVKQRTVLRTDFADVAGRLTPVAPKDGNGAPGDGGEPGLPSSHALP